MTLEEVADYLRVTRKTIYRLLEREEIPSTRVGHQYRFKRAAVEDWLRQNSAGMSTSILVIDDDEELCEVFRDTLEEAGHKVTTATDPARGLDLAIERDYDLVFLDLRMPGMDGAELFRQLRAAKPDVPVTIVTAYSDSEIMANALDHGPFGVMKKPFTSADITNAVRTYIHSRPRSK